MPRPRRLALPLFLLPIFAASATDAAAQVRASERGGAWQTIDGTTIRIEYGRPAVRGRTIFGETVHWGEVWTPGPNWATTLEVDRQIRVDGHVIAPGEYSVWIVPGRTEWTFHLHPQPRRFHTQWPGRDSFAVSIPITPGTGPHVERLTFDFPELTASGATLRMRWAESVIELPVCVRATLERPELPPARMAPFLGTSTVRMNGGPQPREFVVELFHAGGHIRGRMGGEIAIELIATDEPLIFRTAFLRDGEIFDVEEGPLEFRMETVASPPASSSGASARTSGWRPFELVERKSRPLSPSPFRDSLHPRPIR